MIIVIVMLIGAIALGIVLLAVGIVIGWFSPVGARRYDRALRVVSRLIGQVLIVGLAVIIVALIVSAYL
jgi:hypothetical protein